MNISDHTGELAGVSDLAAQSFNIKTQILIETNKANMLDMVTFLKRIEEIGSNTGLDSDDVRVQNRNNIHQPSERDHYHENYKYKAYIDGRPQVGSVTVQTFIDEKNFPQISIRLDIHGRETYIDLPRTETPNEAKVLLAKELKNYGDERFKLGIDTALAHKEPALLEKRSPSKPKDTIIFSTKHHS